MAVASFQALCEGMCGIFGVTPPALRADANGLTGFTLQLLGVDISVVEAPAGSKAGVFMLVEFGSPPEGRELQAWHALLDANFLMLGVDAPSFSRNPVTGGVVLQHACALHDATCEGLCAKLRAIAEVAVRWREDCFLGDPADATRFPQAVPQDERQPASVFV